MANERGISFSSLLDIKRLRDSRAFLRVALGKGGNEVQYALSLLESGECDRQTSVG